MTYEGLYPVFVSTMSDFIRHGPDICLIDTNTLDTDPSALLPF